MAEGVGDDLLDGADERQGHVLRRADVLADPQVDVEAGDVTHHGAHGLAQVGRVGAKLADGRTHVTQQVAGHPVGAFDVLARARFGTVPGHLQLQGECRELVAHEVVQLAGDAQALVRACGVGQDDARRPQLHVRLGQLAAHPLLPDDRQRAEQRRRLDQQVEQRVETRPREAGAGEAGAGGDDERVQRDHRRTHPARRDVGAQRRGEDQQDGQPPGPRRGQHRQPAQHDRPAVAGPRPFRPRLVPDNRGQRRGQQGREDQTPQGQGHPRPGDAEQGRRAHRDADQQHGQPRPDVRPKSAHAPTVTALRGRAGVPKVTDAGADHRHRRRAPAAS